MLRCPCSFVANAADTAGLCLLTILRSIAQGHTYPVLAIAGLNYKVRDPLGISMLENPHVCLL